MPFQSETALENHIRFLIQNSLSENNNLKCLDSKSIVDITICRNEPQKSVFFIEAKLYKPGNNRIGIGNKNGYGIQTDILFNRPDFFENNLRWILAKNDVDGYLFLDNAQIMEFVNNGIQYSQQNNIQPAIFNHFDLLDDHQILQNILEWLNH